MDGKEVGKRMFEDLYNVEPLILAFHVLNRGAEDFVVVGDHDPFFKHAPAPRSGDCFKGGMSELLNWKRPTRKLSG